MSQQEKHGMQKKSIFRFLTKHWHAQEGSVMILATFGLLLLMGVLALSIDHGQNYMNQSNLESRLTAQTKYAGREYTEWKIDQYIHDRIGQYPTAKPKDKVILQPKMSEDEAKTALKKYVSDKVFEGNPPTDSCLGGRISVKAVRIRFSNFM